MNAQIESFWPADIGVNSVVTPVAILREQASMLAAKTRGLVEGQVSTQAGRDNQIYHSFRLVAPALGGYRYELFRISHSVLLYPIQIESDSTSGVGLSVSDILSASQPRVVSMLGRNFLKDENEFKQWLKDALSSQHTRNVVNSLLSQSVEAS